MSNKRGLAPHRSMLKLGLALGFGARGPQVSTMLTLLHDAGCKTQQTTCEHRMAFHTSKLLLMLVAGFGTQGACDSGVQTVCSENVEKGQDARGQRCHAGTNMGSRTLRLKRIELMFAANLRFGSDTLDVRPQLMIKSNPVTARSLQEGLRPRRLPLAGLSSCCCFLLVVEVPSVTLA